MEQNLLEAKSASRSLGPTEQIEFFRCAHSVPDGQASTRCPVKPPQIRILSSYEP